MKVGIVIPAFNEELSVAEVIARTLASRRSGDVWRVVVADNLSTDRTAERARAAGAEVVAAIPRGYGQACLSAIAHLGDWPEALAFLDADGSSRPEELDRLLAPIREGRADMVIGRRPANSPMTPPQRWGTRLAANLIRLRWRRRCADIGPFRAITRESYSRLGMQDQTWGWTVEMQILAVLKGLRVEEVPTSWERRIAGKSKISGTVGGVVRAGGRILWTIGRHWLDRRQA